MDSVERMVVGYNVAVWRTRGQGLVKRCGDSYIFLKPPVGFPLLGIGHEMPKDWEITPANDLALK